MEKLLSEKLKLNDDTVQDPMSNMPKTKFSSMILKSVIGEARANQVLTSMSETE